MIVTLFLDIVMKRYFTILEIKIHLIYSHSVFRISAELIHAMTLKFVTEEGTSLV